MIGMVRDAAEELAGAVPIVYVEDYVTDLGRLLTSGTDIWLNTPEKTREASGAGGAKAAQRAGRMVARRSRGRSYRLVGRERPCRPR